MHRSEISPFASERAKAILDSIVPVVDPAKTAHVIIDLQNAFVAPGAPAEIPGCRDIIPNVNKISSALRSAGGVNVFLRFTVDEAEPRHWASMHRRVKTEALEHLKRVFGRDSDTHKLWAGLDISNQDIILDKTRFSALTPGTCELQKFLEARAIETVIITGTQTNCCCEATARDAMQLGYSVLLIQDGCATTDDTMHNNTLSNLCAFGYADICTADEALGWIAKRKSA